MSSFLGAAGSYGFIRSASSSSAVSSTLSKSSSVTSLSVPTTRARKPRKRPNQSYMEAATLLSTACPNVFSTKNLHKKCSVSLSSLSSSSLTSAEVLFPVVFNESEFLIEEEEPSVKSKHLKIKPFFQGEESRLVVRVGSPPGSPPGYDVNSIFDDEAVEGIDSILGRLSMDDCEANFGFNPISHVDPFVGKLENKIRHAMRETHQSEDRLSPAVMVKMQDICPESKALPLLKKKKKTLKKKKLEELKNEPEVIDSTTSPSNVLEVVKAGLGLKLNHEDLIEAWGDRGPAVSRDSGTPETAAEISARLAKVDLSLDRDNGKVRETSVQRYLEKKKARHFTNNNKIRYQVRKVNADCKPRMKGRFVKKAYFLHEAIGEES